MFLKKILITCCAAAGLLAGAADARNTLRVGTEPTFAPFEFMDTKSREFVGYDIDLIRTVADKAGYDIEVVNMGFDALIPGLAAGTVDVVAAGVSITPERAERVDFTEPYYRVGLSMIVRRPTRRSSPTSSRLRGSPSACRSAQRVRKRPRASPGPR